MERHERHKRVMDFLMSEGPVPSNMPGSVHGLYFDMVAYVLRTNGDVLDSWLGKFYEKTTNGLIIVKYPRDRIVKGLEGWEFCYEEAVLKCDLAGVPFEECVSFLREWLSDGHASTFVLDLVK